MIARLLIQLDGSWMADRALAYATVLARAVGARLVLLSTVPASSLLCHAESRLRARAAEVQAAGVATETCAGSGGSTEVVLDAIRSWGPDLVVMAAESWCRLGQRGGVAHAVARHAAVPVLLVPVDAAPLRIGRGGLRILVALDGSTLAEQALTPARVLADTLGADLLLLRVVPPRAAVLGVSANGDEPDLVTARRYVEDLAHRLRTAGRRVVAFAVTGDLSSMIAAVSRAQAVSMIVMTTRGRSGFGRSRLGDIARKSLHAAGMPLLLVPPMGVGASGARSPASVARR